MERDGSKGEGGPRPLRWHLLMACKYSIDRIYCDVSWVVENTDEFAQWWSTLSDMEQESIAAIVQILEEKGQDMPFPFSSGIKASRHDHMRELRIQVKGAPFRVFYAFDPRRTAILLIGGDKTGDKRFYKRMIPIADDLYDVHLAELAKEGLI